MAQWLGLCAPNAGVPGLIPGQGTGSHMLQLRVCRPQLKILHAANNTQCSKQNKYVEHMSEKNHIIIRGNGDLNSDYPKHYLLFIHSQTNFWLIQDEDCRKRQTFIQCLICMKCFTKAFHFSLSTLSNKQTVDLRRWFYKVTQLVNGFEFPTSTLLAALYHQ